MTKKHRDNKSSKTSIREKELGIRRQSDQLRLTNY